MGDRCQLRLLQKNEVFRLGRGVAELWNNGIEMGKLRREDDTMFGKKVLG